MKNDGILVCWSALVSALASAPEPPAPPTSDGFRQVSVGGSHICGLKTDGSIVCWGDNTFGQLAPAPLAPVATPTLAAALSTATPPAEPRPTDPPMDSPDDSAF